MGEGTPGPRRLIGGDPLRAVAALASGACVASVLVLQWATGSCWKALDNPATRWIGRRSYSLYLVHTG